MSFLDCISSNPALKPSQVRKLTKEYNDLYERYSKSLGDSLGAQAAAQHYVEIQQKILTKKNENAIRDILSWNQINAKLNVETDRIDQAKARAGKAGAALFWGKSSIAQASREVLEKVYTRQQAIERRATLSLAELIEKYRSKKAGITQDVEGFREVITSVLGTRSGNPDVESDAKAMREVFDILHKQYEQAGGILGKLDNYFPQSHNPVAVGKAGYAKWREAILPRLNREKMVNPQTALPFTDAELEAALRASYDNIRTNGLNDLEVRADEGKQTMGKGGGVAARHSSSRFFHFKDAESFLAYNREFGYGDAGLFDAMLGHIGGMSRDIALLQEMGPNPHAQIERMKMKIQASGAGPQAVKNINGMYDVLSGRNSYTGELPTWYRAVRGLQDWLRSSYLGGAPVSAMSDSFYSAWTAKMNGVPATAVLKQYAKILNPANAADRRMARRQAFIAGSASGHSIAQARFADDFGSHGMTGWLANFTNRASGLGVMTDAVRQSVVLSTQGFLAEAKAMKMTWKNLPPEMREAFGRWDMGETEYKEIMSSTSYKDVETEADFLRPEDVSMAGHGETARKYEMWLIDMAQEASNEPRLLTRAITTGAIFGDASQGTALRATASSFMMFKSFGITVMLNHLLPSLRHAATAKGMDRLSRIAPMLIGTTLLGAAAMQAKQVLYGKTPLEPDTAKFWGAAFLQGGGAGIFGDFLFTDYSRFNQDFITTFSGPVAGFTNDAFRVFMGNFDKTLSEDEESKFIADFHQFAERNLPAVKLWYTRLLLERLLWDHTERMVDPNFDTRMRRMEQKMSKDYGQKFWWAPGDNLPATVQ